MTPFSLIFSSVYDQASLAVMVIGLLISAAIDYSRRGRTPDV